MSTTTTRRTDGKRPLLPTTDILDRQLPFDLKAEIGLLGSIMLLPDVLDDVVMIMRPDDFYDDAHKRLYVQMVDLHESNKKIDLTLLLDRLRTSGDLEAVGGAAFLSKLINGVPNAAHAVYYAEIVRDKSTLRALISSSTEILKDAYEQTKEPREILDQSEQRIFSILDDRSANTSKNISEILHEAMDRIEARVDGKHVASGVDTGFVDLDNLMSGLHKSELIILAARPSMGKTAFAMNIAENVVLKQRDPVLFVSLEMSGIELADRLLCSVAEVNSHRLRSGSLSQDDRLKLIDKASVISDSPLFVDDSPTRTVTEIAANARRIKKRQGNLGLIVVDYLQLIEPDNPKDPRQEQVAKIARRLKILARELKVPVLCLAQLNRQTETSGGNIPRLSHLRESGAIEQDADVVMFVHREEYYLHGDDKKGHEGKAQIIVAKQRNGPVGDINLHWFKEFTRFKNAAPERYSEFDQ